MPPIRAALLALLTMSGLAACGRGPLPGDGTPGEVAPNAEARTETAPPRRAAASAADEQAASARVACLAERARIAALPELPGAPAFEARRGEILGRAKSESVVFLRAPEKERELPLRLSLARDRLAQGSPIMSVPSVMESLRYFPEDARRVLLAEGYVYAETPEMATTLVDVLKLSRLFREREIFLARGGEVMRLERDDKGGYRYTEGDQRAEEASLLFGDRVGLTREAITPLLHRDLSRLVEDDAPARLRITRLTTGGALADLRYGDDWVPAALADDGQHLTVACLLPAETRAREVAEERAAAISRSRAVEPVRDAIRAMVGERLRFDEPLEEVGQQDGSLRPQWKWAYDHGGTGYSFNGIGYPVFDASGRPAPPQVCVDFVLDAYERASGTWFRSAGEPRERLRGKVDFDVDEFKNRRSAAELVSFLGGHPEMFRIWTPPDEERVPFGRRADFFASLAVGADRWHVGDVVVIHGVKPDGQVHYHSFVIDAIDPISGIPHRLAGNAGRPRLQTWEGVMRGAPLRSIRHVLSPELPWLTAVMPEHHRRLAGRTP